MSEIDHDYVLRCAQAGDLEPLAYKLEFLAGELTGDERKFLADYITGRITRPSNRPRHSPRKRWEAMSMLDIILCEEMQGGSRTYAKQLAAQVCGVDKRTLDRRLELLESDDEEMRKTRLENLRLACSEIDERETGRGAKIWGAQVERIMSGTAFRDSMVRTKTP